LLAFIEEKRKLILTFPSPSPSPFPYKTSSASGKLRVFRPEMKAARAVLTAVNLF